MLTVAYTTAIDCSASCARTLAGESAEGADLSARTSFERRLAATGSSGKAEEEGRMPEFSKDTLKLGDWESLGRIPLACGKDIRMVWYGMA